MQARTKRKWRQQSSIHGNSRPAGPCETLVNPWLLVSVRHAGFMRHQSIINVFPPPPPISLETRQRQFPPLCSLVTPKLSMTPSPPLCRETSPMMARISSPIAKPSCKGAVTPQQRVTMLDLLAVGVTVTQIVEAAGVTRGVVRYRKQTGGQTTRAGCSPFFTEEDEKFLFQLLRVRALVGRGLGRDAVLVHCQEYILSMSTRRKSDSKRDFGDTTKLGPAIFGFHVSMAAAEPVSRWHA